MEHFDVRKKEREKEEKHTLVLSEHNAAESKFFDEVDKSSTF